jgi:putative inorganic carbon (HCO3(-)) transporter
MKWLKQLTEKQVVAFGAITLNVLILLLYKREPQNALWLVPVALLGLYLVLFQFEWLFRILLFILPFSLNVPIGTTGLELSLPSEPIMMSLSGVFVLKLMYERSLEIQLLKHPVTLLLLAQLFIFFLSASFSEFPIISFKYCLARSWFVISGYFVALYLFQKSKTELRTYFGILSFSMVLVVSYITINHLLVGVNKETSYFASAPFFKEHTIYGGVLGFFVPLTLYLAYSAKDRIETLIWSYASFLMLLAVIFSYTRAAWLGVLGAMGLFVMHWFRIKLRYVTLTSVIVIALAFVVQDLILMQLKNNDTVSDDSFEKHFTSIYNTKSDPSNAERVNRWDCAISMFKERPVLGWGIGTYTYTYAPFQKSQFRTIISTNRGDVGNVHSEYLGPLSETGLLGFLTTIGLYLMVVYTALRTYYKNNLSTTLKWLNMALLCGLYTYWIHGFMNNYLDIDKASFTFWLFMAGIVYLNYLSNHRIKD